MQHLDGSYDEHPVQFVPVTVGLVACTVCGATVESSERWKSLHRNNHDEHNKIHDTINEQARRLHPTTEIRLMVAKDRSLEAKKIRQERIKMMRMCACLWPLTVYRNGSGHDDVCPVHEAYLERRDSG